MAHTRVCVSGVGVCVRVVSRRTWYTMACCGCGPPCVHTGHFVGKGSEWEWQPEWGSSLRSVSVMGRRDVGEGASGRGLCVPTASPSVFTPTKTMLTHVTWPWGGTLRRHASHPTQATCTHLPDVGRVLHSPYNVVLHLNVTHSGPWWGDTPPDRTA